MNVGIGTVVEQFLFWEYLFRTFGILSPQCNPFLAALPQFIQHFVEEVKRRNGGKQVKTGRKTGFYFRRSDQIHTARK